MSLAVPTAPAPVPPTAEPAPSALRRVASSLSSLRLTVVLLFLGILVVFFGTLAQTEDGLYLAQQRYFRSWFSTWSPHAPGWKWLIVPLPGGYLLGSLLVGNLLAAHYVRFKFSWRKSGILLSHFGVILLILGQLATDMLARESNMSFAEGEWRNYSEDFQKTELAILKDAPDASMDQAVVIPDSLLVPGAEIRNEHLPFVLRVERFAENALVRQRAPMIDTNLQPASTSGTGAHFIFVPEEPTREMNRRNLPGAVVAVSEKSGRSLGTWLVALGLREQTVTTTDGTFRMILRQTRYYQPFSVKLLKTTHEVYEGTSRPKNFQSHVLIDRPGAAQREVDIYMNNPLRYDGLTFFQSTMGKESTADGARGTTGFQVVKNPSWLTPYFGCGLVAAGLLIQFGIHLTGFLRRPRRAKSAKL